MCDEDKPTDLLLFELLTALRRSNEYECWCEMAIGNPMMRGHSSQCKRAHATYQRLKGKLCTIS